MSTGAGGLSHERAWDLLPWLVNGTLESPEREGVEDHVATCGQCRAEAERCRSLGELVRAAEVAPSPHPAQLARLLRRVDELEGASRRPGLVGWLGSSRVSLRWALAAQAATLLLLLGVVFWPSAPPSRYRTLNDPPAPAVVTHQVRVVFAPTTTETELRRLLLEVRGELIAGPSPLGAYTVAVPADGQGAEPMALVLEHLRASPRVRLAEPVTSGGSG